VHVSGAYGLCAEQVCILRVQQQYRPSLQDLICAEILALLKKNIEDDGALAADDTANLLAEAAELTRTQSHLFRILAPLAEIMRSNDIQSPEKISNYRKGAELFGEKWREYFKPATPKVHMLETDCPRQLDLYKRLGWASEEPMEAEHAKNNYFMKLWANIRSWPEKMLHIFKMRRLANTKEVKDALRESFTRTKRNFSAKTLEKKAQKEAEKLGLKTERLTATFTALIECDNYTFGDDVEEEEDEDDE
jgi:hypothetical protein